MENKQDDLGILSYNGAFLSRQNNTILNPKWLEDCLRKNSQTIYFKKPVEIKKEFDLDGILNREYISKRDFTSKEMVAEYIQQAEAIHRARLNGYSQEQIAEKLEISTSTVSARESEFYDLNEVRYARQKKYIQEAEVVHELREEGKTYKEVSEQLGISTSAVGRRIKLYSKIQGEKEEDYLFKSNSYGQINEGLIDTLKIADESDYSGGFEIVYSSNNCFMNDFYSICRNQNSDKGIGIISEYSIDDEIADIEEQVKIAMKDETFLAKVRRFFLNKEENPEGWEHVRKQFGLISAGILNRINKRLYNYVEAEYTERGYKIAGESCKISPEEVRVLYNLHKKIERKGLQDDRRSLEEELISYRTYYERQRFLEDLELRPNREPEPRPKEPELVHMPNRNLIDTIYYGLLAASLLVTLTCGFSIKKTINNSVFSVGSGYNIQATLDSTERIKEPEADESEQAQYEEKILALRNWAIAEKNKRLSTTINNIKDYAVSSVYIAAELTDKLFLDINHT